MGWFAKKSYGQHALHDKAVGRKLVEAMPVTDGELIVEVGPGEGALTKQLVDVYPNSPLVLIEADASLIEDLRSRFPQAQIIQGDAALVDYGQFNAPWHFLSNLPYNASAAILKQIFQTQTLLESMVIIAQKEQAQRMLAQPGEMSMLSLSVQLYATGKKLFDIAPGSFNPPPKVDSRALVLTLKERQGDEEVIMDFARPAFAGRRKQLSKTIARARDLDPMEIGKRLEALGLSSQARPQELSVEQWRSLRQVE